MIVDTWALYSFLKKDCIIVCDTMEIIRFSSPNEVEDVVSKKALWNLSKQPGIEITKMYLIFTMDCACRYYYVLKDSSIIRNIPDSAQGG